MNHDVGQGDTHHIVIRPAVVGLISGGIRNREHLEVAEAMRASCQVVIALGTCATHGGIPSMMNGFNNEELLERYYRGCETTDLHADPGDPALPPLLDRTYALDEKSRWTCSLPGCPPHPDQIGEAIIALLEGRAPNLPTECLRHLPHRPGRQREGEEGAPLHPKRPFRAGPPPERNALPAVGAGLSVHGSGDPGRLRRGAG